MMEYFASTRKELDKEIRDALESFKASFDGVSRDLGEDTAARLAEFAGRGKMLRGVLVRLGYELAKGDTPIGSDATALRRAGAAMELFQSGLLAHDDIMDRDRIRRGYPTMHVAYETALVDGGFDDPPHYGEALGICAGDLAFFAAFRLLSELPIAPEAAVQVSTIAARELCIVGVAQMQDVLNGAARPESTNPFRNAPLEPGEDDILRLYRYKTGRYTFSMPLALGCVIAGGSDAERLAFEEAGEMLGVVFQLKDDELGLFADEEELGKPVGADIREDKKTLFRHRLLAQADGETEKKLRSMFGNRASGTSETAFVREKLQAFGVRQELATMMKTMAQEALGILEPMLKKAPAISATAFRELVRYSLERRS
ncbi:polyprenyl synthetase family protein [Spirochaetota bacterium]